MEAKVFGVTELNEHIKLLLESDYALNEVYVRGELSNYKIYPSGHHYFSVKDTGGALKCVMFKGSAVKLRFKPENGMSVIVNGRITVYPRDGVYQLYATGITSDGVGDLYVAFEQLKDKLLKEGLFDPSHKKPIPRYPRTIAVITSSAGAAVRDIIKVLRGRWPMSTVKVMPVRVQGVEAPAEIVGAIRYANVYEVADLIITGRGGGSIEDLWAFNDERVVREIFNSEIPVITAVGHEPDVTISDFVSDLSAATPSNAAELAVPDSAEIRAMLLALNVRLGSAILREIRLYRQKLSELSGKRVMQSPVNYLDDKRITLDRCQERLISGLMQNMHKCREKYARLAVALDAMSPLKVLGRGYAIAKLEDGTVIKTAKDVSAGDKLTIRLKSDEVRCTVDGPVIGG